MSFHLMAWASEQKTGSGTRKAVLLALANVANHHTGQCNPSIERLSIETEFGVTAVKCALKELTEMGLISRSRNRRGDGSLSTYSYQFPKTTRGDRLEAGADSDLEAGADSQEEPGLDLEPGEHETASNESVSGADLPAPRRPRRRNVLFDALARSTEADVDAEAGRIAAALNGSRGGHGNPGIVKLWEREAGPRPAAGAAPPGRDAWDARLVEEIERRAAAYGVRYPGVDLTPTALAHNWGRVLRAGSKPIGQSVYDDVIAGMES